MTRRTWMVGAGMALVVVAAAGGMQKAATKEAKSEQARPQQAARVSTQQARRPALPVIGPPRKLSWRLKAEDYPRTDGSTSAHPLGVLVACRLTGLHAQWTQAFGPRRRLAPLLRPYKAEEGDRLRDGLPSVGTLHDKSLLHGELRERTHHVGTHGSWMNLIDGKSALIFVCRRPSADEDEHARQRKVAFDIRPIALDAFVFLRNVKNPVDSLHVQQIRDIYAGRITNWRAVGGGDQDLHAYQRNRNSGSQETMERLVMRGLAMPKGPSMIGHGMIGPYNRMRGDPHGMGFTFWYYNAYMQPDPQIETLSVGGVRPGPETIRSRRYVYTTEVYAVTRADEPDDATASRIQDWLATPEGQAVVAESGYAPIAAEKTKARPATKLEVHSKGAMSFPRPPSSP